MHLNKVLKFIKNFVSVLATSEWLIYILLTGPANFVPPKNLLMLSYFFAELNFGLSLHKKNQ